MSRIVTADDVCLGAEAVLKQYLPGALRAVADHSGTAILPMPSDAAWAQSSAFNAASATDFPAVIISTPGWSGEPEQDAEGWWHAKWVVNVSFVSRGESFRATQRNVRHYAAAVRAVLVQHPDLGGIADGGIRLTDERYDRLTSAERTLGAGTIEIEASVSEVTSSLDVADAPATEGPTVETTFLDTRLLGRTP